MHDRVVVADFYLLPNHADGNARGESTTGIRQYERWKRRLGYGQGDTVDGVWLECWYAKCSGKPPTPERFAQDQGALISMARAGLVTVVDEPGLAPYSPAWREAFGVWVATTGRAGVWDRAYFNLSSGPWVEALR
jgi:hypothetical protein